MNVQREDAEKIKLYDEFYQNNLSLFKKDKERYWNLCTKHVEEKLIKLKYGLEGKV